MRIDTARARTATWRRFAALARPAVVFAWLSCAPLLAIAEEARAQDAAEERSQSFQSVEGAVQEDVPGGPLLVAAYAAIFALVLLYVVRLVRLQQRAEADVQRLERVLAREAPSDASGG